MWPFRATRERYANVGYRETSCAFEDSVIPDGRDPLSNGRVSAQSRRKLKPLSAESILDLDLPASEFSVLPARCILFRA